MEDAFPCLADLAARRFPLVARAKPICRPLATRIEQVRTRADQAAQGGPDALMRAAEALNLAALIASDCGLPGLARELCWRQFDIIHAARPLPRDIAKLALQPVVNLARLLIRAGHGGAAFTLLDRLFTAVIEQTDADLDGRAVDFDDFTTSGEDHREVGGWLWQVVLVDSMRALAREGRWEQARAYAGRLKGVGDRLWEGRQVTVLAHCFADNPRAALDLVQDSDLVDPAEAAVGAALAVLCLGAAGETSSTAARTMTQRYLQLEPDITLLSFVVSLGLTVFDLTEGDNEVHTRIVRTATAPGGAYAARELLAHPACSARLSAAQAATLTEIVRAAGLGLELIPPDLEDHLFVSVLTGENAASKQLAAICGQRSPVPSQLSWLHSSAGSSPAPSAARRWS